MMTRDATALLNEALRLPEHERIELAARLHAQRSSVISSDPEVMSGAPVFKGTRVLAQTLIEYLEAGDSIDEFIAKAIRFDPNQRFSTNSALQKRLK